MNLTVISNNQNLLKNIKNELDALNIDYKIKRFQSMELFLNSIITKKIDGFILDLNEKDWINKTYEIQNRYQNAKIILVSSNLHSIYRAFDIQHIGFIYRNQISSIKKNLKKLIDIQDFNQYINFLCQRSIVYLNLENIIYIESYERKTIVHTNEKDWITYKHIDQFTQECGNDFVRIHQSFLVNKNYITCFSTKHVVLDNSMYLSVSKRYIENIKNIKEGK